MDSDLLRTTQEFAARLRSTPIVANFWNAQSRLETDAEAQRLLDQLQRYQQFLVQKQQDGEDITPDEIETLRRLQGEAQSNETIIAFIHAQRRAQTFLSRVNQEIGRHLGFDFGGLARTECC